MKKLFSCLILVAVIMIGTPSLAVASDFLSVAEYHGYDEVTYNEDLEANVTETPDFHLGYEMLYLIAVREGQRPKGEGGGCFSADTQTNGLKLKDPPWLEI